MSIKAYRPTTPAQRQKTTQDFDQITTKKPLKSLVKAKKQNAGKNNQGRITVRHRGGGVKRHYRILTHNLPKGLNLEIMEIEYDPNRSARIARVKDQNGTYYYGKDYMNPNPSWSEKNDYPYRKSWPEKKAVYTEFHD